MTTAAYETDRSQAARKSLHTTAAALAGERVVFLDRLTGMARRDAQRLVRQHGGTITEHVNAQTTIAVIGDEGSHRKAWLERDDVFNAHARAAASTGQLQFVRESQLWARIGLIDGENDARRLYTPAMLADLVGVPVSTVRRWHRKGILCAAREVRRLAFFDFTEVTVARRLSELLTAGCSLRTIERKLDELSRKMSDVARPLAELPLVVEGKQLLVRRGDDLSELGGQLLLDFEPAKGLPDQGAKPEDRPTIAISIETARSRIHPQPDDEAVLPTADEMLTAAIDLENDGELAAAAEMYRAFLVAGPTADANFLLADVLYRLGDRSAARERYYAAIELDETFVEARANLGCILAESGDLELAIAAFEGALALEADYPDVHFYLARTLDAAGRTAKAETHWQSFLDLAPDSPWADEAEIRLEGVDR